uniref:EGF-like domain-containing protein n=1 Tax=Globodera rostochiensis TaxID=31243 RepID=A0A914I131_GLORO
MGIVPEATWATIVLLFLISGGTIARGNEKIEHSLSTNSTEIVSTAVTTYAVVVSNFDCRLSGMECFHDGICSRDGTHCDCSPSPNWFGRQCELRKCAQRHNPCINGAECEKTAASFKCHCVVGFTGTYCESAVPTICDKTDENPCVHGKCRVGATVDDFVCDCHFGYTGTKCTRVNFCQTTAEICLNGDCVNDVNGSRCECRVGWTGNRCELDIDECWHETTMCQNGGKCVNTMGAFYCECPSDFVGQFCDVSHRPNDPCLANQFPCLNGGQCHENIVATTAVWAVDAHFDWRWECECPHDFEGRRCERAVDDCAIGRPTCLNGGQCARAWAEELHDSNGTVVERNWQAPQCKCLHGFEGYFCEQDIDECEQFSGGLCQNGGTCMNRHGSYLCICVGGFDGKHCEINLD